MVTRRRLVIAAFALAACLLVADGAVRALATASRLVSPATTGTVTPSPTGRLGAVRLSWLPALASADPSVSGPLVDVNASAGDWRHAWQVVGLLLARPPREPVVLYFGDSTARESFVSEAAWTRQLRQMGAPRARAYALAGHGQTFAMDRRFLDALPPLHGLALIGVSLSRFAGPPLRGPAGRPASFPPGSRLRLSPWRQHLYDAVPALTPLEKVERVVHWRQSVRPRFRLFRRANLHALARLVADCKARGLRPVLVELPINVAAIGGALDAQRAAVARGCRAIAARYGVRFAPFKAGRDLPSSAFYDTCHLVRPGYTRWQRDLSRLVVWLLRASR